MMPGDGSTRGSGAPPHRRLSQYTQCRTCGISFVPVRREKYCSDYCKFIEHKPRKLILNRILKRRGTFSLVLLRMERVPQEGDVHYYEIRRLGRAVTSEFSGTRDHAVTRFQQLAGR